VEIITISSNVTYSRHDIARKLLLTLNNPSLLAVFLIGRGICSNLLYVTDKVDYGRVTEKNTATTST
jgi:hypothetical protein